ncbi:MAG: hypothetical protein ACE3JN_01240 [Ectobacillus sp.]
MKRKAATPEGKAAQPRLWKASACSGTSTIKFNRALFKRKFNSRGEGARRKD